jgi:hypothetical protein
MKPAKTRSNQRKTKDGVRLTSEKVAQPVKKGGIEDSAVAKAVTERLLDEYKTPEERIGFQTGWEEAKQSLARLTPEETANLKLPMSVEATEQILDASTDRKLTPKETANLIMALVDFGDLSLEKAEQELVKLQTAANGGIPIDEDETKKAVDAAIESVHSIVAEIHAA